MDPDLAVQRDQFNKLFVKTYKMLALFTGSHVEVTSSELNNSIGDPSEINYIKEVKSLLDRGLKEIKEFKFTLENIDDEKIVFLDDHHTYPEFFNMLTPENQAKIPEFERSISKFNETYKMINELMKLNGLGKNKRRSKRRLKRKKRKTISL